MATKTKPAANAMPENIQGYFRVVFKENPKLLKERSNDALYERWLKDHPGKKEVPERVKQSLANLKSILRKHVGRRKRMKAEDESVAGHSGAMAPGVSQKAKSSQLMRLESAIDEALILADNSIPKGKARSSGCCGLYGIA